MSFENKKNIAFVLGRFTIGGVERVIVTMANAFSANGWHVCIIAFSVDNKQLLSGLNDNVIVEELSMPAFSLRNIMSLHKLMHRYNISYVINNWALPFTLSAMLRMSLAKGAKLIAFHHTMPNRNGRLQGASGLKKFIIEIISRISLRIVYHLSDAYVVLSPSLMQVFRDFTGLRNTKKLAWIPNPINIEPKDTSDKEKVLLFVGRLSQKEKRVDRVIDVWANLLAKLPDWRLDIVGDGPDMEFLQSLAKKLERVTFRGFDDAMPYFQKSKILLLTSDFEGFPMVLVEAMANGCVPIVYGSFPSVYDVVNDGCGVIVPVPWDSNKFSDAVLRLIQNNSTWVDMSQSGKDVIYKYSVCNVFNKYIDLLQGI